MNASALQMLYYYKRLKKLQWMNKDELKKIQLKKLKKIIEHAYNNVQFYQDSFNSLNIKPHHIRTLNDLKRLPIITKTEVRESYPNKITSRHINIDKCYIESTTGSTGLPLKICFTNKERRYITALFNYFYGEAGAKWHEQIYMIRHYPTSLEDNWKDKLKLVFFRRKSISVFEPLENIIKKLIEINPEYIITFPSVLSLIAEEIKTKNIRSIKPKVIFAMSETITASLREELSQIFNSDILGHYGSEEFGTLAIECKEHCGYHVMADHAIIEILKDNKNCDFNEKGEVIVTSLNNYAMPLIRYKLGDIAILSNEKCKCGRGLPLIREIVGREDDYIILPSGRKISPRMINVIENIPGIISYKTIQESKDRIVVKLVKGKEFSEATIHEVKEQIKLGCLGEEIKVEVELVKEINRESRGKIRAIVSNIS